MEHSYFLIHKVIELLRLEAGIDIYDAMLNDTVVAYYPLICIIGCSSYKFVDVEER